MVDFQSLSLPAVIQMAATAYSVPQRAVLADLSANSRHPSGIGPMGIAKAWLPRLQQAGFVPLDVETSLPWNVAAGTWILAQELHRQPIAARGMTVSWQAHPVRNLTADLSQAAVASGVPATFLAAVMMQESGGDPDALSPKGAMGLMQLIPATAKAYGVTDPWNPRQNLITKDRSGC